MESRLNVFKNANRLLQTAYCKLQTANLPTAKLPTANRLLLTTYCLLLTITAHAQLFPVQVNQSIIPPYNTKLNSYATSTDVKLRLFLTLTDVNVSNRQVRLKLKIQGQGLNIQSTDFVTGAPQIFLNGGTQQQFTNIDLAPYFQLNNLLGINPQLYNQPLPDGTYRICWEVYDFLTNQRISSPNMGCTNIFLLLNDPPFLNLPNRGDQLTDIQPTNIIFQWTPRHANATNVSYEFELREIWDEQIDPQAGFFASPPYHTETTFSTTLLYNIGKPQLFPGRTYAWRVRAISSTGLSENSVFRNDGYSEVFYFTYTNQCFPPTFTLAEPLNTGRVKISWQTHPDHNKYNVQYKRADVPDAEWFEVFSYNNQVQIANLQDGVTYHFRVGGTCHELTDFNQAFSYSSINQFTMPTADEAVSYNCGIVPEIEITNTTPLGNLGVNETFTAGDFPVTIKQIQGGNGVFSGTGFIVVPYLADTKIAVEFSGIKINTDYQLFDGIIQTTYDADWGGVESVDDGTDSNTGDDTTNETDDGSKDETNGGTEDNTDEETDDHTNDDSDGANEDEEDVTNDNTDDNNSDDGTDDGTDDTTDGGGNDANDNTDDNTDNPTDENYLYILNNGQKYYDGDKIEFTFKRDFETDFHLKGVEDTVQVVFGHNIIDQEAIKSTFNNEHSLKLKLKDNPLKANLTPFLKPYLKADESKNVKVDLHFNVKPYTLKDFKTVDAQNEKRIAIKNKTLYFIDKKNGGYDFRKAYSYITPSIDINYIPREEMKWSVNETEYYEQWGDKHFTNNYKGNEEYTVKLNTSKSSFENYIKFKNSYDLSTDLFQKFNKVLVFLQEFNNYSRKFGKVLPCEVNVLNNFNALKGAKKAAFNIRTYNDEDSNSREIFDIIETSLKLNSSDLASLKCSKSIGWSSISLGNIYIKASLGSNIDFKYRLKTRNETGSQETEPNISGGISLKLEGGLESNPEIDDYLYATANLNVSAGTKAEWPYNGDKGKISTYLYTGKTYLTVNGYVDGWLFGGREDFNLNYELLDTSWKSDTKLIFDIKNGDIYLENN